MLPDIKGTLFWLAVVLLLLFLMMRGCGHRLDRFRERRDQWKEERQEHRDQRHDEQDQRDGHRWRWREKATAATTIDSY